MNAVVAEALPWVRAPLRYLEPAAAKPYSYEYDPPAGVTRTTAVYREHIATIHDLRPLAADLSLDREGFRLVTAPTAVADLYDEEVLRNHYYPEAVDLLRNLTGAARVVVFDHTIRRRIVGAEDRTTGLPRQPVPRIHNDYTVKSGPQRVRDLLGDEADGLLRGRFAVINVWRPIRGPLQDAPLAVCDARSVERSDLVATDLIYRDRVGEIYYVKYNPAHRWLYAPDMGRDEALLIKCFDSAEDGRARFVPHSAFNDPAAPANVLPRESIELRTLVFYPDT